jgi:hypothetical protein
MLRWRTTHFKLDQTLWTSSHLHTTTTLVHETGPHTHIWQWLNFPRTCVQAVEERKSPHRFGNRIPISRQSSPSSSIEMWFAKAVTGLRYYIVVFCRTWRIVRKRSLCIRASGWNTTQDLTNGCKHSALPVPREFRWSFTGCWTTWKRTKVLI